MDKRIRKTEAALYRAFAECLNAKDYASLSVEDILRSAKISRSTFYAHFKTKDDLLDSILRNIFRHVFSSSLKQEETHDFSHESTLDYEHLFTHTLYHLRDEKEVVQVILKTSCRDRFLNELRRQIAPLAERCVKEGFFPKKNVPEDLRIQQCIESFVTLVSYWFQHSCAPSPEDTVALYIELEK